MAYVVSFGGTIMNFLALLGALALNYYRPHTRLDWLHHAFAPYARMLERNCNDGKNLHGIFAWILGAFLPALIVGVIYFFLLQINVLLAILFGVIVLYLTLRFGQFGQHAEKTLAALREGNIEVARDLFARWESTGDNEYKPAELARLSIETILRRTHHGLFGPIFWFVVLGPAGALFYRLTHLLKLEWHPEQDSAFNQFTRRAFEWLDWLPTRVTAGAFAVVGDFEDAVYCWRTQALSWPDKGLGIILASGAGALGVKLGEPIFERGILLFRPEIGLGDEADADYLQSAIGLVWRVLVLMLGLLFLLTFAHWIGK